MVDIGAESDDEGADDDSVEVAEHSAADDDGVADSGSSDSSDSTLLRKKFNEICQCVVFLEIIAWMKSRLM